MEPEINPALTPELDRAQEEIELARSLISRGGHDARNGAIGRLDVAIRYLQGVRGSLVFDQDSPSYPPGTILGALSGKRMLAEGWTPGDPPADPDGVDDQDEPHEQGAAPMTDVAPYVPPQFTRGPEQLLRLSIQGAM